MNGYEFVFSTFIIMRFIAFYFSIRSEFEENAWAFMRIFFGFLLFICSRIGIVCIFMRYKSWFLGWFIRIYEQSYNYLIRTKFLPRSRFHNNSNEFLFSYHVHIAIFICCNLNCKPIVAHMCIRYHTLHFWDMQTQPDFQHIFSLILSVIEFTKWKTEVLSGLIIQCCWLTVLQELYLCTECVCVSQGQKGILPAT